MKSLELRGSWDDWRCGIHLNYIHGRIFSAINHIPAGEFQYKFIYNHNDWITESSSPIDEDTGNNIVKIEPEEVCRQNNLVFIKNQLNIFWDELKASSELLDEWTTEISHSTSLAHKLILTRGSKIILKQFLVKWNEDGQSHIINILPKLARFEMINTEHPFTAMHHKYFMSSSISRYGFTKRKNLYLADVPSEAIGFIQSQLEDSKLYLSVLETLKSLKIEDNIELGLKDYNFLLYSVEAEDQTHGLGTYHLQNFRKFIYGGLTSVIRALRHEPDLDVFRGHLNQGLWMLDYYVDRLFETKLKTSKFTDHVDSARTMIHSLNPILRFTAAVELLRKLDEVIKDHFLESIKIEKSLKKNPFIRKLLLAVPQFFSVENQVSAGLPHFCVGIWKQWGRDTFIAFNGLLLSTKLYSPARAVILDYAKSFRHGLIPNLKDPARYNCRDAVWWYFKAVIDYINATQDYKVLEEEVELIFTSDVQHEHEQNLSQGKTLKKTLLELLQEVMRKHSEGIRFWEWNKNNIDDNMRDGGHLIELKVNWHSGFVFGGNSDNCLTWMDKMGSHYESNRGLPGSPRTGAPIELSILLIRAVEFMNDLYKKKISKYEGVARTISGTTKLFSYGHWVSTF